MALQNSGTGRQRSQMRANRAARQAQIRATRAAQQEQKASEQLGNQGGD